MAVFLSIVLYISFGYFVAYLLILDSIVDDYIKNPLWKLPIYVLWPISLVIMFVIGIAEWLLDYYKEVRDYYKNKKGDKDA